MKEETVLEAVTVDESTGYDKGWLKRRMARFGVAAVAAQPHLKDLWENEAVVKAHAEKIADLTFPFDHAGVRLNKRDTKAKTIQVPLLDRDELLLTVTRGLAKVGTPEVLELLDYVTKAFKATKPEVKPAKRVLTLQVDGAPVTKPRKK